MTVKELLKELLKALLISLLAIASFAWRINADAELVRQRREQGARERYRRELCELDHLVGPICRDLADDNALRMLER